MNTPAHLIISAAAFGKANRTRVTLAAILGGIAPDVSLYALYAWFKFVLGYSDRVIFREWYFSELWQGIFAVDNSFILWGLLLALALWIKKDWLFAFSAAGFLHLILDFFLHHDDARRQFWPISNWVFESPVSYWDGAHYGGLVGPLEIALCLGLSVILWRRHISWWARTLVVLAMAAEAAPAIIFTIMFASP